MRRGRGSKWGYIAVFIGVVIIMKLILPTEFWWFVFAALLIGMGLWHMRCC